MTINGLILVGGRSRRMGTDKSVLAYHGRPQRVYLYELLGQFCSEVYVSCRSDQATELSDYQIIIDKYIDAGPMGALLSAFEFDTSVAWLVVACDMPYVDQKTIEFLLKNSEAAKSVTAFVNRDSQPEPLLALWRPQSYAPIKNNYDKGQKSLSKILLEIQEPLLTPQSDKWLLNANTHEVYQSFFQ